MRISGATAANSVPLDIPSVDEPEGTLNCWTRSASVFFALERGQGHFRFEGRSVDPAGSFAHRLFCSAAF